MHILTTAKKIGILLSLIFLAHTGVAFAGTESSFQPVNITLKEGQRFTLSPQFISTEGKNYTVRAEVKYPADIVSVTGFEFEKGWMPLTQPGYDAIDNGNGVLIKTGGYPSGFIGKTTLGKISFVAKRAGVATISFGANTLVLDESGANVWTTGSATEVTVKSSARPQQTPAVIKLNESKIASTTTSTTTKTIATSTIPSQLFDIRLEIQKSNVQSAKELIAATTFDSFGSTPTPVNLTYVIVNDMGKEVFRATDTVTVETQNVIAKKFEQLDLPNGKYTLLLRTLYNSTVQDEFQADFEVHFEVTAWPKERIFKYSVGGGALALLIGIFAFRLVRARKQVIA